MQNGSMRIKTLRSIFTDSGILLLAVIVPLVYPLLYSWIYTNEVTREVPVCVVDLSRSSSSRDYIQKIDGTPDLKVAAQCADIKEAERLLAEQKAYGIIYFPADFAKKTARMEQSFVSVYIDMSFMLYYKTIYMTLTNLNLQNNSKIQLKLAQNKTDREDQLQAASIKIEEHSMYNTTGGYGNFLLQAVIVLIIQQTLILGISMRAGSNRQFRALASKKFKQTDEYKEKKQKASYGSVLQDYWAIFMSYGAVYLVMSTYVLLVTPKIFGFTQHIQFHDFCVLLVPMLFAMLNFAMVISTFFKRREDCMLCIVFSSLPMLFLIGISWPEASIPEVWEYVAWFVPGTPAARAFVRLNEMGASLESVYPYLAALLAQGLFYMAIYFLRVFRSKEY